MRQAGPCPNMFDGGTSNHQIRFLTYWVHCSKTVPGKANIADTAEHK